ncbi:TetR/AcrR family transcriptional regulator [Geodermatophilus sp. TF02-6]|uniref:TetR/AcrR family transcriptional regulator n=1 Tax=Geodermatophilus sp. TF02-6 TaxID=2250575 RepID=UPI001314BE7B|nr:TetR family transcriptional regulator [Geodermatophilus sp. TF02-6]
MARRTEALDAALEVLAERGARGLTHSAVDRRGGLPAGTTSNHFRSRDALLAGVLDHLAERELAVVAALDVAAAGPPGPASFVEELAAVVEYLLGPGRTQTLARHALFLEAAWRPHLREAVLAATARFWRLLEERLAALGAVSPAPAARTLLACVDGLVLDQLVRPQEGLDPAAALRPLVAGLIGRAPDAARRDGAPGAAARPSAPASRRAGTHP